MKRQKAVKMFEVYRKKYIKKAVMRLTAFVLTFIWMISIGAVASFDNAGYSAQTEQLALQLSEINEKIAECKKMGFNPEYEKAYAEIIKKSLSYVNEDIAKYSASGTSASVKTDLEKLVPYQIAKLQELASDTLIRLDEYISQSEKPAELPNYDGGQIFAAGKEFYGVHKDKYGNEIVKPMYLVGYGHFEDVIGNFSFFEKTGLHTAQIGLPPEDIIKEPGKPSSWKEIHSTNTAVVNTVSEEGNTVLKITNSGANGTTALDYRQMLVLEPNTTYTLSFRAKSDVDDAMIIRYGRVETGWERVLVKKSDDYIQYTGVLTTGPSDARERVSICVDKATNGSYIDDITLKKTATGDNVLRNSGFESVVDTYNDEIAIDRDMLKYWIDVLDYAYENNIYLDIISQIESLPNFIRIKYPDIAGGYTSHLNLNLKSDKLKEVLGVFYREVAKTIEKHPALGGFCLANEPEYCTWDAVEIYQEDFREYLKELYDNDINNLKSTYSNGYLYWSFDQIKMPTERGTTPLYYDWKQYNDKVMADFFKWIYDEVKSVAPAINCHIKLMANTGYKEMAKFVYSGDTAFELLADCADYIGCDAYSSWEHESQPLMGKMMMYDLIGTAKDAPIINSEDHVLIDQSTVINGEIAPWIGSDIWLGAIHGRSVSDIWMWGKSFLNTHHYYGSISSRPDVQVQITDAALDLARLSEKVSSFINNDADIAILYSDASRVYDIGYMNALYTAYTAANESGCKVKFVTEKQLAENTVDLSDYKLLIVPYCNYVKDSTVEQVEEYVGNGGKTVLLGNNCLKYNEHKKSRDISTIKDNANVSSLNITVSDYMVNQTNNVKNFVKNSISSLNFRKVIVYDAATDEEVTDVSYQSCSDGEKIYVSVCNLSYENKQMYVVVDGKKQEVLFEERSETELDGIVNVEAYKPVLLSLKAADVEFSRVGFANDTFNKYGEDVISSESIVKLDSGNIMASIDVYNPSLTDDYNVSFIAALYNANTLVDVVVNDAAIKPEQTESLHCVINVPDVDLSDYYIKVFLWNGIEMMKPIIEAVSLHEYEHFENVKYDRDTNRLVISGKAPTAGTQSLAVVVKNSSGQFVALDEIVTKGNGEFSFELKLNDEASGSLEVFIRGKETILYKLNIVEED